MTRILLTIVIVFPFSMMASAQFKKGDILLGGNLSFNYNSSSTTQPSPVYPNSDQKTNTGDFTISLGKAINENTIVGLELSYLPTSITNYQNYGPNLLKYQDNGYGVGVFFRKYKSLGKEFYLFVQIAASYNWSTQTGKDSTGTNLINGNSWSAGIDLYPGIAYKISKHFFLEISIPSLITARYQNTKFSNQYGTTAEVQNSKSEQFFISSSLSSNPLDALGIGFRLIL